MNNIYLYGILAWFVLLVCAVINGTIRDFVYKKKFGELRSHQLSTFTFIFLINFVTYYFLKAMPFAATNKELWFLGAMWLVMTLAFEFLFFHYVGKHSWEELFDQYNLKKGKIWALALIATLLAPILMSLIV